jgi:Tol biopolymer transport system component
VAGLKNQPPPPPPANPVIAYVSGNNLMVMNPDGSNQTAIAASGGRPSWSPDGKHIVFVGGSPQQIYTIEVSVVNGKPK